MHQANIQQQFTQALLQWFDHYGRKDLPWQQPRTPYRVYLSEIMLQQTQVKTVIPYFERFIQHFPSFEALAMASEDAVLALWSGLGYYSRARHLHHSAQLIQQQFHGELPTDPKVLTTLPGIGPSTAAAISSLAFHQPIAILDGNVKRVLARYFMIHDPINHPKTEKRLWQYANACLSHTRAADYTQAIMDLGALCCRPKQPACHRCPVQSSCLAYQHAAVETLPHMIRKKPLPTKTTDFFILYQGNRQKAIQIYLEKRPNKGIWGGLWCLPTVLPEAISTTCTPTPFQTIKHSFTHFHLILQARSLPHHPTDTLTGQWVQKMHLPQLGLPTPIQQLLLAFFDQPSNTTLTQS